MKFLKITLKVLIDIFIAILVIITALFLYSKYISKDRMPNVFGYSILKIVSGSMEPTYSVNDYILIKKQTDYNLNDVVTYVDKYGNFVTHRIVKINRNEIITKGDANNTKDESFDKSKVQGKVICKMPNIFSLGFIIIVFLIILTVYVVRLIIKRLVMEK